MPASAQATGLSQSDAVSEISSLLNPKVPEQEPETPTEETEDTSTEPESSEADAERAPADDTTEEGDAAELDLPDEATITVKVDGKAVKVTGKELRAGYSRHADYTAKTQDVARQREAANAARESAQREREQLTAALDKVKASMEAQSPARPEPSLYQTNPTEFAYQSEMYRRYQEHAQQITAAQQELASKTAAEQQQAFAEHVRGEAEKLLTAIPDWKNAKVATKERAAIADYAKTQGYTETELSAVTDHRAVAVLRDAMRFRQLMAQSTSTPTPVPTKAVTPTLRPGTASPEGKAVRGKAAFEHAAKTGRVIDAADAIRKLGIV